MYIYPTPFRHRFLTSYSVLPRVRDGRQYPLPISRPSFEAVTEAFSLSHAYLRTIGTDDAVIFRPPASFADKGGDIASKYTSNHTASCPNKLPRIYFPTTLLR
jgi:hypothetical protein